MKHSSLSIFFLLFILNSCIHLNETVNGEGYIVKKNRKIDYFDAIELNIAADIYYSQSDNYSIVISTNENLMEHIVTKTVESTLIIETKKGVNVYSDEGINISISSPEIVSFNINGSGSINTDNVINSPKLICQINGSGNINLNQLFTIQLNAEVNGSGDIIINEGESAKGVYLINGSGDIKTANSKTENAIIEINGSGNVEAYVSNKFEGKISGSGDIYYKGTANPLIEIDGSGQLRKL